MQVNMFVQGVPVSAINPDIIKSAYSKVKRRESLELPPMKNITVVAGEDGNFTVATVLYRGRGPISHRYEVYATSGAANRNPNDNYSLGTGISLATYRAMRQLGLLLKERRCNGILWMR